MSDDTKNGKEETEIAGVRLTHPDRVLFPEMGVTKRELAEYFAGVSDAMLPELSGRPVSLVRCPGGRGGSCFFQKHAGSSLPSFIETMPIREKGGTTKDYLLFPSREALVACAQIGALELHLWGSRRDKLERPDRVVFDLDPGEDVTFDAVKKAAADLAEVLAAGELDCWPMLTGGKGIHLVIAVERHHGWESVSKFAGDFARKMESLDPDRFVSSMSKAKRSGRIFIDHFRNERGSTAVAPFSPRAREGAPVAMPVSWDELGDIAAANHFSLKDGAEKLAARVDAWPDEKERRQRLTSSGLERIGLKLA